MEHKVIFLLSGLAQGGLETYLLRFLRWNFKHGYFSPTVFCRSGNFGALEDEYRQTGVELRAHKLQYFNPIAYWKFYCFLRREQFSTICDFNGNFAGLPLLCAKLSGVKVRVAQYRNSGDRFKPTFGRRIYNYAVKYLTFRFATRIIANSEAAFNYFYPEQWRSNKRFQVIYNGIDIPSLCVTQNKMLLRNEFNISEPAFVVGHTGRLNWIKNHETIIDVAVSLCKKYSDIYFVLVGIDVDKAFNDRVKKEGLAEKIILLGYRKDVPRLLHMFDLFYFPSVMEGQPNSLIEAMVVGLPVLASDIAPIKETVPSSFHEKLIPAKDVDCAVDKIKEIYKNPTLRAEYVWQAWAKTKFDGNVRFLEFLEILSVN